jgi:hypothetical protein
MKRRNRSILFTAASSIVVVAAALTACFQGYDPNSASGGVLATGGDGGGGGGGNAPCPTGEVCSDPNPTQCTLGSPECSYLCGSPLCALGNDPNNPDAGAPIPQAAAVPPIYLGAGGVVGGILDGATTTDPCGQVEAESETIRQRSCAPCHEATSGTSTPCNCGLTYILDDNSLTTGPTSVSSYYMIPGASGNATYVVPGNPAASAIYVRIANGQMPPPNPTMYLGVEAGAALAYPTPSDLSVLYGWILNCVQGADGGAYASSYYGGTLGGTTCFGPCGDGGASADAH